MSQGIQIKGKTSSGASKDVRVDDNGHIYVNGESTGSIDVSTLATHAKQDDMITAIGSLTETAPASDTASSGLNGRLQRIAQRLTSLIALLPGSLGQKARAASLAVTLSTEDMTALAPPAAITGFATADNQTNGTQKIQIVDDGGEVATVTGGKLDVNSAAPEGGATEVFQDYQTQILNEIRSALQALASVRGIAADLRVTLLGGTTAVTGSLTSAGTVSTVTTVTGITNLGGIPATTAVPSLNNTTAVLSNINNISR